MGRLGKKSKKGERQKALPDRFPTEGPVGLAEGYDDLSRAGYAVWLRLSVATREELADGRVKIATLLGYSQRRSNEVLLELERKGYISFVPFGPWQPTKVILERRPMIERGKNQFVRLRSVLVDNSHAAKPSFVPAGVVTSTTVFVGPKPYVLIGQSHTYPIPSNTDPAQAGSYPLSGAQLPGSVTNLPDAISERINLKATDHDGPPTRHVKQAASRKGVFRQKFVCEEGYITEEEALLDYRKKILIQKEQEKIRRQELRSSSRKLRDDSNARNRARGITVIDWEVLEEITFNPKHKKHPVFVQVLTRDPRNKQRKKLMERLETEFCRLYSRYRRAADRARGLPHATYEVHPNERKWAAQAGELCIMRGVTPRQVLEYWHAHIKNFKTATMTVPSLRFLSAPPNIDTVACSIVPDKTATGGTRVKAPEPLTKPKSGNSFSDTSGLDVRLRSGLERAGYETQDFNDRYLLTIQKTAIALAMGRDIFVGKGRVRDMARWAAENLYGE